MSTAREQEERKKYIVIGVFAVLLLFVAYRIYDGFFRRNGRVCRRHRWW